MREILFNLRSSLIIDLRQEKTFMPMSAFLHTSDGFSLPSFSGSPLPGLLVPPGAVALSGVTTLERRM